MTTVIAIIIFSNTEQQKPKRLVDENLNQQKQAKE